MAFFWIGVAVIRRSILSTSLLGLALALASLTVRADAYPSRPVQILVGFSAGSGTDLVARRLAEGMTKELGQPVVVMNLPGAGSTLAAARAATSPPDGYTVYLADFSHAIAPSLYPSLPYRTVEDFKGVAPISRFEFALAASRESGFKNVRELISAAQRGAGSVSFGSSGNGSALHLIGEVFGTRTQSKFLHVPFRGGGDVLNSLLTGDIDFAFFPLPPLMAHASAGKIQVLAQPGAQRDSRIADVQTIQEQGVESFDAFTWNILLAPAGTQDSIVNRLANAAMQVTRSAAFREGISSLGARSIDPMTPEQTKAFLAREVGTWTPVVKASGAKVE